MSNWIRVPLAALLFAVNTVVHVAPLLLLALLKALVPIRLVRRGLDHALMQLAQSWIAFNTWMIRTLTRTQLIIEAPATLDVRAQYLVLANHQSWVDIPMLQAALNRRAPLLRFFLKSVLFWVPLLGLAWWALDFPFMKRYSREQVARRPELAGRDRAATRRACARFKQVPVAVMNFLEGTRFTPAKHAQQASPHVHLLKPKAGGVSFVLDAMGELLRSVLDVTIVYPAGAPTFADLFADRVPEVRIIIRERAIPSELIGVNSEADPAARERLQSWINELWREKDRQISEVLRARSVERREDVCMLD